MNIQLTQAVSQPPLLLKKTPTRVVSLVPSITESLIEFGIMPVGRTSFCIEPKKKVDSIRRVGGTKTLNLNRIEKLNPDLVIANLEENTKEQVQKLQSMGLPVWITFPQTLAEVFEMLVELNQLSPEPERNEPLLTQCKQKITTPFPLTDKRVLILIWKDPWMVVGQQTYTDSLIRFAGGVNACSVDRYPIWTQDDIKDAHADCIILPTEPYAFSEKEIHFWQKQCPDSHVVSFSGEDLFWSGLRGPRATNQLHELFKQS